MSFLKSIEKNSYRRRLENLYRVKKMSLLRIDLTWFIFISPFVFAVFMGFVSLPFGIWISETSPISIVLIPIFINGLRVSKTYKNIFGSLLYLTLWLVIFGLSLKFSFFIFQENGYPFQDNIIGLLEKLVNNTFLYNLQTKRIIIRYMDDSRFFDELTFLLSIFFAHLCMLCYLTQKIQEYRVMFGFYEYGFKKEDIVEAMIDYDAFESMKESMIWEEKYNYENNKNAPVTINESMILEEEHKYENNENTSVKPIKLSKKLMDELSDDD